MNLKISIILAGIIGLIAFFFVCSFSIDSTANFLKTNHIEIPRSLETWSSRFLILGIGTLLVFLTTIVPIPIELKAVALMLEFLGGAVAWLFA
jgi:hypothetical protein